MEPKRFQEEQEKRRKWYEEYNKREDEITKIKSRKELRNLLGFAVFAVVSLGSQLYTYGLHLDREARQQAIEDNLRAEKGYAVPSRGEAIFIGRSGTSDDPTTTASYRGIDYLFKMGENGIPYFELMDTNIEGGKK